MEEISKKIKENSIECLFSIRDFRNINNTHEVITLMPFCSSDWIIETKYIVSGFSVSAKFIPNDTKNHTIKGRVTYSAKPSGMWSTNENTENFNLKSNYYELNFPEHEVTPSNGWLGGYYMTFGNGITKHFLGEFLYLHIVFHLSSYCECIQFSTEAEQREQEPQSSPEEANKSDILQLSADLLNAFTSSDLADVEFRIGAEIVPAHKFLLCIRSTVFRTMFETDMREKRTNAITVEDSKKEDFVSFLRYLYSGVLEVSPNDVERLRALYYLADKYAVKTLHDTCRRLLRDTVAEDNVCDLLLLADRHSDEILRTSATQYICENFKNIQPSDAWKHLVEVNPGLASSIVYSVSLSASNSS